MKLYLVRHGSALPSTMDPERPLSDLGRRQAERLADFLVTAGVHVEEIWHSSKVRACETARILHDRGGIGGILSEVPGLLPSDSIEAIAKQLDAIDEHICLVSHLPFIAYLAAALTSASAHGPEFMFDTCSMLCLERAGKGAWAVRWLVSPDLLP